MLLQQEFRNSGIYRENTCHLERKRNVLCKRTTIFGSEVGGYYKKVVFRFRVELD